MKLIITLYVQVTIGAITPGPSPSDAGRNYYRNPVQVIGTPKAVVGKGVDLNAPGNINGEPVLDFDLDSLEEKPWRKPGTYFAVITSCLCNKSEKNLRAL